MEEVGAVRLGTLARLREASWSYLLGLSFFLLCVGVVGRLMAPASMHRLSQQALLVAPLLPLVAKLFAQLPLFVERAWHGARAPVEVATVWRAVIAPFVAIARYQVVTWRGFAAWLRRAQPPALPKGERFGFIERGSYSTFVAIMVFSALVDLPLNGFILSVMVRDPDLRHVLHLVLAPLALYTLYWLFSDRWLMRAGGHVLTQSALELKLGGRGECGVPFDAIDSCEAVSDSYLVWCAKHKVSRRAALSVTPLDRPNVLLVLKTDAVASALCFGAARTKLSHVFVYVDSPGQLIAALRQRVRPA